MTHVPVPGPAVIAEQVCFSPHWYHHAFPSILRPGQGFAAKGEIP